MPFARAEMGERSTESSEYGLLRWTSGLPPEVRAWLRLAFRLNLATTSEGLAADGWVFKNIESSAVGTESEGDLKGLFDDLDMNSPKLGNTVAKRNEKIVKILDAIGDLPLGSLEDNTIDMFGDAYEYLMTMYASAAGKSGGEFFTPPEVSELLARLKPSDTRDSTLAENVRHGHRIIPRSLPTPAFQPIHGKSN